MKLRNRIVIVIVLVCLFIASWGVKGRSAASKYWEYKVVHLYSDQIPKSEEIFNQFGAQGWELVQFVPGGQTSHSLDTWYFKRAK